MPFFSRKSPRLKKYDYSQCGMYFVTICTHEKRRLFGDINMLNTFGCIAETELLEIGQHHNSVSVEKYVVMPNHIHAVIFIDHRQENTPSLSQIIGWYKAGVSRKIRIIEPNLVVWHRSFYDRVIRNEKEFLNIWTYIDENPLRWELDEHYVR